MDNIMTVRLHEVERVSAAVKEPDKLSAGLGDAVVIKGDTGPQGEKGDKGDAGKTSYLYADVEDGNLVIYGGESDDITFALNDNGELEVLYGS